MMRGCFLSQSMSSSPSRASRISPIVSLRCTRPAPAATAKRCRSWLPRTISALPESQSFFTLRSVFKDCGPRLTMSPTKMMCADFGSCSRRPLRLSRHPCRSPMAKSSPAISQCTPETKKCRHFRRGKGAHLSGLCNTKSSCEGTHPFKIAVFKKNLTQRALPCPMPSPFCGKNSDETRP